MSFYSIPLLMHLLQKPNRNPQEDRRLRLLKNQVYRPLPGSPHNSLQEAFAAVDLSPPPNHAPLPQERDRFSDIHEQPLPHRYLGYPWTLLGDVPWDNLPTFKSLCDVYETDNLSLFRSGMPIGTCAKLLVEHHLSIREANLVRFLTSRVLYLLLVGGIRKQEHSLSMGRMYYYRWRDFSWERGVYCSGALSEITRENLARYMPLVAELQLAADASLLNAAVNFAEVIGRRQVEAEMDERMS